MADGLDGAIDTLKEILNSPDAADTISSMLGAVGLGGDAPKEASTPALPPEMLSKVMAAYKSLGSGGADRRVTLLRAVRPFMRETRRGNVDTAIQMLTLFRLMPLLGEFKDLL